jgi:cobalamin biosynthesis protein CobT
MGPVNIQFGSYLRDPDSTSAYRVAFLLLILVFLGGHASTSMAHGEDQPTAEDLTTVETPPAPISEEAEPLKSETSAEPSQEGEGENGDESTTGQQDIAPAIEDSDSTESESKTGEETSDEREREPVTKVVILVQGNTGILKPIRGAEVFVSIKDHDDMQTSTNAKGLANINIPSGRVKIQVTAKDWKTFGEFYDLKGEIEEIQITLESRKRGDQ